MTMTPELTPDHYEHTGALPPTDDQGGVDLPHVPIGAEDIHGASQQDGMAYSEHGDDTSVIGVDPGLQEGDEAADHTGALASGAAVLGATVLPPGAEAAPVDTAHEPETAPATAQGPADVPAEEPTDGEPNVTSEPSDAADETEPEPEPMPAGSTPPPVPPENGDVPVAAGDGDDDGGEPVDPALLDTTADAASDDLHTELRNLGAIDELHAELAAFEMGDVPVTSETRETFDTTVTELQERLIPMPTVHHAKYVANNAGTDAGPRLEVNVARDSRVDGAGNRTAHHHLYARVVTTPIPNDPMDAIRNPAVYREFIRGETHSEARMDDTTYDAAIAHLEATTPPEEMRWYAKVVDAASTAHTPDEIKTEVNKLLDEAPAGVAPSDSHEWTKKFAHPDGTVVSLFWSDNNDTYMAGQPEYVTSEVALRTADRVHYNYRTYHDGTEQFVVEAETPAKMAELRDQGIEPLRPGEGGRVRSEDRRAGNHQPTERLMRRLNALIREATGGI